MKKEASYHKRVFLFVLASAFGATLWVLRDYLSLIFLSLLYSILIQPLFAMFKSKFRWPGGIAAIATVCITFFTIVIPLLVIAGVVVQEAFSLQQNISQSVDSGEISQESSLHSVNKFLITLPGVTYQLTAEQMESFLKQIAAPTGTFIANTLINIGTSSASFIGNLFLFLVLVFFILPSLGRLRSYVLTLSPLPLQIDELYMQRILSMTRAMVKGTFLVAMIQGVSAGFLLLAMGVSYTLILTIIMTFLATVPILSTSLVTIPIALYFILTGSVVKGIIIMVVQFVIISNVDNVLRPMLASGEGHLHPAVLLLAILGGIQAFGFLGLFYGPIILIFLTTSLEVYNKHYR